MKKSVSETQKFIEQEFERNEVSIEDSWAFAKAFCDWEEENLPKRWSGEPWWSCYAYDIMRYENVDDIRLTNFYETDRENVISRFVGEGILPTIYPAYFMEWFEPEDSMGYSTEYGVEVFWSEEDLLEDFYNTYDIKFKSFEDVERYAIEYLQDEKKGICNLFKAENKEELLKIFDWLS